MRAYLIVTGTAFGLLTVSHLLRAGELLSHFPTDPWYVVGVGAITILAGGLTLWAWRLFRQTNASTGGRSA